MRRAGTMAPGGRLASESPVTRRRARMAGASVPLAWVWGAKSYNANDETLVEPSADWVASVAAGEVAVGFAVGTAADWTAPAGWTVLASGSHGQLDYCAAYKRLTGSDSFGFTSAAPGNVGENDNGLHIVRWWNWTAPSPMAPLVTVTGDTGRSTPFTFDEVAGRVEQFSAAGAIATAPEDFTYNEEPDWAVSRDWTVGWNRRLYAFRSEITDVGTVTITEGGTSSLGSDYVGAMFGWPA